METSTEANAEPTRQLVRLRGRSYVAFVFSPVVPIVEWLSEIDATLADPKLYDRDPARVATLGKERAEAVSALAAAEDQWLALSSDYESAMAEG